MSVGIGSKSKLAYVVETTYGTFPTAQAGTSLGFLSENLQNSRNTFASDEINSTRQMTAIRSGNVSASGDISMELSPNALGTFFKHLLMVSPTTTTVSPTAASNSLAVTRGSYYTSGGRTYLCTRSGTMASDVVANPITSTDTAAEVLNGTAYFQYAGAGSIYKHVFQAAVAKPTGGISIEREVFLDSGSKFFRYTGGRINNASINVPQEGIVTCGFGFLFLDLDSTAASSIFTGPVTPLDEPFAGAGAVVRLISYGGSLADDFSISQMSLNIDNGFDGNVYTVGQRRRRDLPEGRRTVSGNMSCYFENMTKFDYFQNESTVTMEVSFNHLGQFLLIALPETKLTSNSGPNIGGNGVISQSFDFMAFKNAGAGDIKIELYNTTSSY